MPPATLARIAPRVLNIPSFGAVPNDPAAAAVNREAIQSAVDAVQRGLVGTTAAGEVFVPAGDWYVSGPIFLDSQQRVGLRGEGKGISRILTTGTGHDILVSGVARRPNGLAPDPGHVVDAWTAGPGGTPLLDRSACPGPGRRWALRTLGVAHVAGQGGALDVAFGDQYRACRQLTIDVLVDLSRAPGSGAGHFPAQASFFGLTERGTPSPYEMTFGDGRLLFSFRTALPGIDRGVNRAVQFWPVPAKPGVVRITVQLDLPAARLAAFVDGVQVVTTTDRLGPDWKPGAGLALAANPHCPFGLGSNALTANGVADNFGSACDLTFGGLKVTADLVYRDDGPGSPQARLDGLPIDDDRRYFRFDNPRIVGLLPLLDPPAKVLKDRLVTIAGKNNYATTAFLLDNAGHASPNASTAPGPIRNLSLRGNHEWYGRGIATGFSQGLAAYDCELMGGHQGVGPLNFGANYPMTFVDCDFAGTDAPFAAHFATQIRLVRPNLLGTYRCGIRLVGCHQVEIEGLMTAGYGGPEFGIKGVRSSYTCRLANFDNEDEGGGVRVALFFASADEFIPVGSTVTLDAIATGNIAPGASCVVLEDNGTVKAGERARCRFSATNMIVYDTGFRSVVRTDGPRWSGSIERLAALGPSTSWIEHCGPGASGIACMGWS